MTHTIHNRSAINAEPITETSDAQTNADSQQTLDARLAALDLTDVGNAARLVARYGHDLRYSHAEQKWYVWDGIRWAAESSNKKVQNLAVQTAVAMYGEAATVPLEVLLPGTNKRRCDALAAHGQKTQNQARLRAMIAMAALHESVAVQPEELDADPWLLNLPNGTLGLAMGTLRPHRREDLLTRLAPVAFDPDADCPTWRAFLERVQPDGAVRGYVQRAAGYTLTGDTREQCLFLLLGGGANGKSTFTEIVSTILGSYYVKTRAQTLTSHGAGVPNDVAALAGRRLVSVAELSEGQRLAEGLVKDLTGQDRLVARFLFKEFFEFVPSAKIWLYGNHVPTIQGTDNGIWRRIKLIPFAVTIPESEQDRTLLAKLRAELPGILNWLVEGCLAWQAGGLGQPVSITEAVQQYRADMDTIAQFLAMMCLTGPEARVKARALYQAYRRWCADQGTASQSQIILGKRLREKGFTQTKNSAMEWHGLGLMDADPE